MDKTIDSIVEGSDEGDQNEDDDTACEQNSNIQDSMYNFGPTQALTGSSVYNSRQNQQNHLHSSGFGTVQVLPQSPDILCLLQQQQKLLAQVLAEQKEIKDTQKSFNKRVSTMERQISSMEQSVTSSSCSPSPSSNRKRRRITRDLTVSIHEYL